jgi:hypothetical protein
MTRAYADKLQALCDGVLDPEDFSHRDHVGIAFAALDRYGFFDGLAMVAEGLRGLARKAGAEDKFNATVTLAFVSLIAERMLAAEYPDAEAFLRDNPDLLRRDLLSRWYSRERLASPVARATALLPDRCPQAGGAGAAAAAP